MQNSETVVGGRCFMERISVEIREIASWDGVLIQNPISWRKVTREGLPAFQYGGPHFGTWGGTVASGEFFFYVYCAEIDFTKPVRIKKMKKTWRGFGREASTTYFVVEPTDAQPRWWLYELKSWYKTTLKGYGRDRDYQEHLEPQVEPQAFSNDVEITELIQVESRCRSGRYGNKYRLILTRVPCQIVGEGTP
jgi:hypothetical protein